MNAPIRAHYSLQAKLLADLMFPDDVSPHVVDHWASFDSPGSEDWVRDFENGLILAMDHLDGMYPLLDEPEQAAKQIDASTIELNELAGRLDDAASSLEYAAIEHSATWRITTLQELRSLIGSIDVGTLEGQAELRGIQQTLEILDLTRG